MIFFKYKEFESPDAKGSGAMMDSVLLFKLERARELAQTPFKINSGYRTPEWNKKVGGSANSSHMKGIAVDIHCKSGALRVKIISGLIKAGFTRIGIAKTFIHADVSRHKVDSIWLYK